MTDNKDNSAIRIFCAKACAAPLEKAAKLFTEQTDIEVKISVCSRHCAKPAAQEATGKTGGDDFLLEISEAGIHDIAIAGAEYLLDDGQVRGIVQKNQRRTIAYRTSCIIVPKNNPQKIQSIRDLTKPGIKIGVSVIDCLKGLWEDICGRIGLISEVRKNICYYANGCIAIIEAVATNQVDAAFGWTAFKHVEPKRIEIIELPAKEQVMRGTCVGLLRFSKKPEPAKQFMDFLCLPQSRQFYREFGWTTATGKI